MTVGCRLTRGHEGGCLTDKGSTHTQRDPQRYERFDTLSAPVVGTGHSSGGKLPRPMVNCTHDGQSPSLTLADGRLIYGARGGALVKTDHLDLIIDLAGMVKLPPSSFVKSAPRRFARLKHIGPEYIRLDWPDMTAPGSIGIRFWQTLRDLLPQHTCIACVGSHGRTGTAMAALLIADGMVPELAIAAVRGKHCLRAIETKLQEDYLRKLGS